MALSSDVLRNAFQRFRLNEVSLSEFTQPLSMRMLPSRFPEAFSISCARLNCSVVISFASIKTWPSDWLGSGLLADDWYAIFFSILAARTGKQLFHGNDELAHAERFFEVKLGAHPHRSGLVLHTGLG